MTYHAFRYNLGLPEHVPFLGSRSKAEVLVLFTVFVTFKFLPLSPNIKACLYPPPSACIGRASDNTASSKTEINVLGIIIFVPISSSNNKPFRIKY